MVSPEIIRHYPFFAGLDPNQIKSLAVAGKELDVKEGHVFFRSSNTMDYFYLVVKGEIGITCEKTDRSVTHSVSAQLTGNIPTEDVTVSTIEPGEVFGWSALFPPFAATAGAVALVPSKVVAFHAATLLRLFEEDCQFGYRITQKLAQVIHMRLQDRRIETLASKLETAP